MAVTHDTSTTVVTTATTLEEEKEEEPHITAATAAASTGHQAGTATPLSRTTTTKTRTRWDDQHQHGHQHGPIQTPYYHQQHQQRQLQGVRMESPSKMQVGSNGPFRLPGNNGRGKKLFRPRRPQQPPEVARLQQHRPSPQEEQEQRAQQQRKPQQQQQFQQGDSNAPRQYDIRAQSNETPWVSSDQAGLPSWPCPQPPNPPQQQQLPQMQGVPMLMPQATMMNSCEPTATPVYIQPASSARTTTKDWSILETASHYPPQPMLQPMFPQMYNLASHPQQYQKPLQQKLSQAGLTPYINPPTGIPEGTVYTVPMNNGSQMFPYITHEDAVLSKNPAEFVRQQQLAMLHHLPPGTTMEEYNSATDDNNSTVPTVPAATQNLSPAAPAFQPQHLQQGRATARATPTLSDSGGAPMRDRTQMTPLTRAQQTDLAQYCAAQQQDEGSAGMARAQTTRMKTAPPQKTQHGQQSHPGQGRGQWQRTQEVDPRYSAKHSSCPMASSTRPSTIGGTTTGPDVPTDQAERDSTNTPDSIHGKVGKETKGDHLNILLPISAAAVASLTKLAASISLCHETMIEHADKSKEHTELNRKQATETVDAINNARYTDPAEMRAKSANELAYVLTPLVNRLKACPICRAKVTKIIADNTKPEDRRPQQNNRKRPNNNPGNMTSKKTCLRKDEDEGNRLPSIQEEPDPRQEERDCLERARQELLDRGRADISYHFQMTARSIITNCIWNILHLSQSERERRMAQEQDEICALPMPMSPDLLHRLLEVGKPGHRRPPLRP